jgi:hypothetical protein
MLFCRILGFLKFHPEVVTIAPDRQERYLTRRSPNPLSLVSASSPDTQRHYLLVNAGLYDNQPCRTDFIDIS